MTDDDLPIGRRSYVGAVAAIVGATLGSSSATALSEGGSPSTDVRESSTARRDGRTDTGTDIAALPDRRHGWTARHNTHVELAESWAQNNYKGEPLIDVVTNTTFSVLDASWQDFGNPAKTSDSDPSGCWRYTFRLHSSALALTPTDTRWQYNPANTDREHLSINSKSAGYVPASRDYKRYQVSLSDFVRVRGPENDEQKARRVAIGALRDPNLFGISNGDAIIDGFQNVEDEPDGAGDDQPDMTELRNSLFALVRRTEDDDVVNAARLRAKAEDDREDRQASVNLGLAILGLASLASGGTLPTVLLAVDIIINVIQFFFNDDVEYNTPFNSGFEVKTPVSYSDAIASHFVTFHAYAAPGKDTHFTVDSRHEYGLHDFTPDDHIINIDVSDEEGLACGPKWTVGLNPPANESASTSAIYEGVELIPDRTDFERNEEQGPQPGIAFEDRSLPPDEDDKWPLTPGDDIDVNAYDTLLSKAPVSGADIEWELEWRREGEDSHDYYLEDEGSGWEASLSSSRTGKHRITVTVSGAEGEERLSESLDIHETPNVEILQPEYDWISVQTGVPTQFVGNAWFETLDEELFTSWVFPEASVGRGDDGEDGTDIGNDDGSSNVVVEPETVGGGVSFMFSVPGTYEVEYHAWSKQGFKATKSLEVRVEEMAESSELEPNMSEHVHADLRLETPGRIRVGEQVTLVASDSRAEGPRQILGYDWDLTGTGENFIDLSGDDSGSLGGSLSEGTIEFPQRGSFTSAGERTVQVLAYAVNSEAPEGERLEAGLASLTMNVLPATDPQPAIAQLSSSHPLVRQFRKINPIGDESYWSQDTVAFFSAKETEMASTVEEFRWNFDASQSSSVDVSRRVPGVVFNEFPAEGEFVVELTAVYENGDAATVREAFVVGSP